MASAFKPVAFSAPLSASLHPILAVVLTSIGLYFFAWFVIYEVTNTSDSPLKKKNIVRELYLAGLASFFLGFGVLFLLLWTGVYV